MERPEVGVEQPLTVAIALQDEAPPYLAMTAVLGRSILDSLEGRPQVRLFVLFSGLSPATRRRFESSWADPRLTVSWIPAEQELEPYAEIPTRGTLLRLMLGEMLPPEVERVIWLDVDTMVLQDLGALWETSLGGATLGAVPDPFAERVYCAHQKLIGSAEEVGVPYARSHRYFNAGVLLIDLKKWREERAGAATLALIDDYPGHFQLLDQDVLNLVFCRRTHYLEARWNIMEPPAFLFEWDTTLYTKLAAVEGVLAPGIRHLAGNNKPWSPVIRFSERQRFFDLLDRTEWRGWRPATGRFEPVLQLIQRWLDFHWLTVRAFWWPRGAGLVREWGAQLLRHPWVAPASALYFLRRWVLLAGRRLSSDRGVREAPES